MQKCPSGYKANTQNKCEIIINDNDTSDDEDDNSLLLCQKRINTMTSEYESVEQLLKDQMNTFKETNKIYN